MQRHNQGVHSSGQIKAADEMVEKYESLGEVSVALGGVRDTIGNYAKGIGMVIAFAAARELFGVFRQVAELVIGKAEPCGHGLPIADGRRAAFLPRVIGLLQDRLAVQFRQLVGRGSIRKIGDPLFFGDQLAQS